MSHDYKSFDLALEWSKQLMGLGTGSLVLSATFIKDVFGGEIEHSWLLVTAWILFVICVLAGLFFMGSLCALIDGREGKLSIYDQPARTYALVHWGSFVLALIFFALFSSLNLL